MFRSIFIIALIFTLSSCVKENMEIQAPDFYTFERNGESTVDFSGQTARILMAEELVATMLEFEQSQQLLLDMFANENEPFTSSELNSSGKSLKSKVAASKDFFETNSAGSSRIKQQLSEWIAAQTEEIAPYSNQMAALNTAGQIADGEFTRYINAKGIEFNQVFAKSLIGALMTDQMLNNYLSPQVLDAGNNRADNDAKVLVDGKTYTSMEHKWDEAFGYLFGTSADIANPLITLGNDDSFLNKYLAKVNQDPDFNGIDQDVFEAFKMGRLAIEVGDYKLRDQQSEIIRQAISTVIAARAVYYLQQGKKALIQENFGSAFHDLSEALGFLYSLQFTREPNSDSPYFSDTEVEGFIAQLVAGNGFWDLNPEILDEFSSTISAKFSFSLSEAAE